MPRRSRSSACWRTERASIGTALNETSLFAGLVSIGRAAMREILRNETCRGAELYDC
jgi:hypothetical protein